MEQFKKEDLIHNNSEVFILAKIMKKLFLAITLFFFLSCHNTKAMSTGTNNGYGREEQVTDTVLHSLQQNNELVLAFAIETWAWEKTVTHRRAMEVSHEKTP